MFGIAVPWLKNLVTMMSRRRTGLYPRLSPCGICGGQTGTETGFSRVLPLSCFSIVTPTLRVRSSDFISGLRR